VFCPFQPFSGLAEHRRVTIAVTTNDAVSPLPDVACSISADDARDRREIVEREFERVGPP
jgi:hypothetical protein